MGLKRLLALLVAATFIFGVTACGDDSKTDTAANDDAGGDSGDDGSGDDSGDDGSGGDSGDDGSGDDSGDDGSGDDGSGDDSGDDGSDTSIPEFDPGDIDDAIGGEMGDCLAALTAWGQIAGAMGLWMGGQVSEADFKQLEENYEKALDSIPEELHDEAEVVHDTYADLWKKWDGGEITMNDMAELGEAFDDEEFVAANETVSAWLTENCEMG